jgi:hypothetical protein
VTETVIESADEPAHEVAELEPTGHPRVDEVLMRLRALEDAPTADHVAVYDEIHRALQDVLADLDEA